MVLECIFYDFDGVMTDNRALIDSYGNEQVFINRSDGYAIAKFKEMGIRQVIVSTEKNNVVEARGKKLGIEVIHGVEDKGYIINDYCTKHMLMLENCAFIGNDLNDEPAFKIVGFKGAPLDAEIEVKNNVDWISTYKGGYGVIRDFFRYYATGGLVLL